VFGAAAAALCTEMLRGLRKCEQPDLRSRASRVVSAKILTPTGEALNQSGIVRCISLESTLVRLSEVSAR
jgi:hypothetical protein